MHHAGSGLLPGSRLTSTTKSNNSKGMMFEAAGGLLDRRPSRCDFSRGQQEVAASSLCLIPKERHSRCLRLLRENSKALRFDLRCAGLSSSGSTQVLGAALNGA